MPLNLPTNYTNTRSNRQARIYLMYSNVSASLENGDASLVKVVSEKGGLLRLVNPFKGKFRIAGKKKKITEKKPYSLLM